jgi:hypothetical protein
MVSASMPQGSGLLEAAVYLLLRHSLLLAGLSFWARYLPAAARRTLQY